jgi:hypothetical protein
MKNNTTPLPDLKLLNEMFSYCDKTGSLLWKERPLEHFKSKRTMDIFNNRYAGKEVGATYKSGYKYFNIGEVRYLVHRVIWKMHSGVDPEGVIDHIDRDCSNNTIENLRDVTSAVNGQNRSSSRNTSGEIGVSKTKGGKWKAFLTIRNNTISLGTFDTIEEAKLARLDAEENRTRYDYLEAKEIVSATEITLEYLKECFVYENDTGFLYWKNRPDYHFKSAKGANAWNSMWSGKKAGYLINGYWGVKLVYKPHRLNRIIWWMITGNKPDKKEIIDHINGDTLDNRSENLRICSHFENSQNKGMSSNNTSGYKGVTWSKKSKKWQASIRFNNTVKWLGYHDTPELAYAAYCKAASELHKEYANFGN